MRPLSSLLPLLLLVALALPASAAPLPDAARDAYERGLAKYNLAEFDAAIVEFKQSYELSKAPRLLFNIAQAYRLKKDYASALYFYSTYLRAEPDPPNLGDVESKIDEMKHALDEQKSAQATVPPASRSASTPATDRSDRAPSKRALEVTGIAVAALGVVSVGIGGGMLGLSASDAKTLHQVAVTGMPWTSADQAVFDRGGRAQTAGIVLLSVGGALVVGGGITLALALRR